MSQPAGVSLGERYRLEKLLGQGGMGSVYRAHDRLTGQRVALKLVPVDADAVLTSDGERLALDGTKHLTGGSAGTPSRVDRAGASRPRRSSWTQMLTADLPAMQSAGSARYQSAEGSSNRSATNQIWARMALAQEFRTLASLRHPHIISVLDYGFIGRSQPFFTMELLEHARSLATASKGLPLEHKAQLLGQLLRALSYLHRHGILHRDLKSANVMVVEGGEGLQVKLLDFGLALARSHVDDTATEVAGTIACMAPELFQQGAPSESADLFAVGVIAYELFAHRHPFYRGAPDYREAPDKLIESILHSEPEWEPLKEQTALTTLLRRLLAKSPAARPSADEALTALFEAVRIPVANETAASRESTLQAARFVGREDSLTALRAALESARSGSGDVRLLAGESGVGKSRLMDELRVYALVQGVLSARGQAVSEGGGAYGVWREILRTLCLGTELGDLDASVLKGVVPDLEALLERTIPDAPALHPQAAQLRLLNTLESLLLRKTEPLLLILEDLHWADAESLALLRRLTMSCRSRPTLILASYRDDERPNLPQELPGCQLLKLARLTTSSITELCQSMLGDSACTPGFISFLEEETEGNVFFIIEVMRALAEAAGQLSLIPLYDLPKQILTGGIQAIVQRRLTQLPEEARPLLRLAAVAGRQLDLAVLRHFEPRIEPWLYRAADAAVLEVSDQVWRFAHDKIRESLLRELDAAERQRLHLLLAQTLESTYPGSAAHAAGLAEHYQRGGMPAKAAFYLVEAGVQALAQGATEQSATLLDQALAPERLALLPRVDVARAFSCLVQAKMALGRIGPCIATYERFMAHVGFPIPTGFVPVLLAGREVMTRRLRVSVLTTEEDWRVWSEVAQATRSACEAYVWGGQPGMSILTALRGAELADSLGDSGLLGIFFGIFSYLAGLIPLRNISQWLFEKGSQNIESISNPRAALDFRRVASARHINAANWEAAKAQLDALIAASRKVGDEHALMFGLGLRTIVATRQDEQSVLESAGAESYARGRRNQSDQFARIYPLNRGVRALHQGDIQQAQTLFAQAEVHLHRSQDVLGRVALGGVTALCLFLQGDRGAALQRAQQTMEIVETTRFSNENVGEGIAAIVEMYLCLWESSEVTERRQFADPLRRALSALRRCARIFPSSAPRALLWHGRYAWNRGAARVAQQLAEASQRSAQRTEMPYDVALADEWLKRFAEGAPGGAFGLASEIRGIFQLLADGFG